MGLKMKKTFLLILAVLISASSTDGMAYTFVHIGDSYPTFCTKQFKGDRFCSINYDGNLLVISFFNLDYIATRLKSKRGRAELLRKLANAPCQVA